MNEPSSSFVTERRAFSDRDEAAELLAEILREPAGQNAVLLAIARGAVPMGARIARRLMADFDVLLVRKLGAPGNPEFALGAVDEDGVCTFTPGLEHLRSSDWLTRELARQRARMADRRARYGPVGAAAALGSRTVIVVDDGLATGATMVASLDWARRRAPGRLICAVPVGSSEAIAWAAGHADQLICPWRPAAFGAVSQFYAHFEQVSDEEVLGCLMDWRRRAPAASPAGSAVPREALSADRPSQPAAAGLDSMGASVDVQAPRSNSRM